MPGFASALEVEFAKPQCFDCYDAFELEQLEGLMILMAGVEGS